MAEPGAGGSLVVVGQGARGSLVVADRVVSRIAGHVALEVDGVLAQPASTRHLTPSYPHVRSSVTGGRASVDIEVAVAWGARSAEVAQTVQDRVRVALTEMAGVEVLRVGVLVAAIAGLPEAGRVR